MAIEPENETVEVQEVEEIVDGKIRKKRRTIRTNIQEEIVEEPIPDPEPKETIEVQEIEEIVDGKIRKRRRTIRTQIKDEIVASKPVPEPELPVGSRLLCQCVTPSGVPVYGIANDNGDGTYTLDVNASEPGIHSVTIEQDGKPIPGSPFKVRIVQAGNKAHVRMYGSGLESGIIGNYEGLFHIDTKGAGPGDLKVLVRGPKGGFTVHMSRDSPEDRIINAKYFPTLPGIYTISALWSGEHIPGSPYELFISPNAAILHTWFEDPEKYKITHACE